MNGSSRAPKRDEVRRTPFATARSLPWRRLSIVKIRSASPSLWVRRTTTSSRKVGTSQLWRPPPPAGRAARTAVRTRILARRAHNRGVDEPLFVIPLWADLTAVGLGGIQGALFASGFRGQRRLDLLGVAIIGIVMGMGGGLIRDLLLNVTPRDAAEQLVPVDRNGRRFDRDAARGAASSGSTPSSSASTRS